MTQERSIRTRTKILDTAVRLLNTRGYAATGVREITEKSGIGKGNLYFHFKNKEALTATALENAASQYGKYISSLPKKASALKKIKLITDAVCRFHEARGTDQGCLFGNLALETAGRNNPIAGTINKIFQVWINTFAELIRLGQSDGSIRQDINSHEYAKLLIAAIEGGIMISRLSSEMQDLRMYPEQLIDNMKNRSKPDDN